MSHKVTIEGDKLVLRIPISVVNTFPTILEIDGDIMKIHTSIFLTRREKRKVRVALKSDAKVVEKRPDKVVCISRLAVAIG